MMTKRRLIVLGVVGLFLAIAWILFGREFMLVDRCLDMGGRWKPDTKECEVR